ncbi:MAG: hypothetical protein ACRYFB_11580 [Janthinobacterium lividum]
MTGWAINTHYVELPELQRQPNLPNNSKGIFSIESELSILDFKKNSPLVFIKKNENGFIFINIGTVTSEVSIVALKRREESVSIVIAKNKAVPKDKFRHTYNYLINKTLEVNNSLNDLKYSLKAVDNFGKHQKYFEQQFRQLIDTDFKTITNGYIYTARTVFGKLVNSIPRQNKLEFMLNAMEKFKTIDFTKIPLLEGIDFLINYLNRRILSWGKVTCRNR